MSLAVKAQLRAVLASPHARLALLFLVATLVFTWPLVLHLEAFAINTGDPFFISSIMKVNIDALAGRASLPHLPFFFPHDNAYFFSEPYIGHSILVLPFSLFTGDPIALYNIGILLGFFLNGWGTSLLVRRLFSPQWRECQWQFLPQSAADPVGRRRGGNGEGDRTGARSLHRERAAKMGSACLQSATQPLTGNTAAAAWAGIFFAFIPYKFNQIEHIHVFSTEWLPLFLWATHRWLESKRWRAALLPPLFLALQAHAGMVLAVFWYLPVALLWLWILGKARGDRRRVFVQLAVQGAIFLAIVLPVLIPMAAVHKDLAIVRQSSEIAEFSANPASLLGAPASNLLYGKWLAANQEAETALFIGFMAMLLVVLAIARKPKGGNRRIARVAASFGLLYVLFAFGPNIRVGDASIPGPYRLLQAAVPGFDSVRTPARAFAIGALGLAIAGAFGCLRLAEFAGVARRRLCIALPWIACGVTALEFFSVVRWENVETLKTLSPIDKVIADLPGNDPVVYFPVKPNRYGPGVLNRELFLTYHQPSLRRPIVNGYSGYFPEFHRALEQSFMDTTFEELIPVLAAFGVKWFVYDPLAGDLFFRKRAAKAMTRAIGLKKRTDLYPGSDVMLFELAPVVAATAPAKVALRIPAGQAPGGRLVVEAVFTNESATPIADRRGRRLRLWWRCGEETGDAKLVLQPFWVVANDSRAIEAAIGRPRTLGEHRCSLKLFEGDTELTATDLTTTIAAPDTASAPEPASDQSP